MSKAYIRFPGGTSQRWEKIAEMVGRPVHEVGDDVKFTFVSFLFTDQSIA